MIAKYPGGERKRSRCADNRASNPQSTSACVPRPTPSVHALCPEKQYSHFWVRRSYRCLTERTSSGEVDARSSFLSPGRHAARTPCTCPPPENVASPVNNLAWTSTKLCVALGFRLRAGASPWGAPPRASRVTSIILQASLGHSRHGRFPKHCHCKRRAMLLRESLPQCAARCARAPGSLAVSTWAHSRQSRSGRSCR